METQKELNTLLNKNYKLLALDIDGTLITSDHLVTPRTLKAIKKVKDLGIRVTIATGRHYHSVRRLARIIGVNAPMVCCDGAIITDKDSSCVTYHLLPHEIAVDVMRMTLDYEGFKVLLFVKSGKIYGGRRYQGQYFKRFFRVPLKYTFKGYLNLLRDFAFMPIKNMGSTQTVISALEEPVAKVFIYSNGRPGDLKDFINKITAKYGEEISITSSIPNCIDVLKGGVSKAKGLIELAETLGISHDEIITVGDNYNDIEMLKYAGLGVAMGNAPELVKSKADYVTDSNDDEGLAKFLEKLISHRDGASCFQLANQSSVAAAGKLHQ